MKLRLYRFILCASLVLTGCSTVQHETADNRELFKLSQIFPTDSQPSVTFNASVIASPVLFKPQGKAQVLVPVSNGEINALDADTGALLWRAQTPILPGQEAQLIASPVLIDDKLVVAYQAISKGVRSSHHLAVLNLSDMRWDSRFPLLTFSAEQATADGKARVKFNPPTAYSHAALQHIRQSDSELGLVYVAFGNASDVQPFHGWVFEIDMSAWRDQGTRHALKNVLLTTPEADCPVKMAYGTQEMVCGGGVWVPSGLLAERTGNQIDLFIPTGNGQVNLARHDYANAVLKTKPGLKFDAGCDMDLCKNFNPSNPNPACLSSCKNLFIPRLAEGNAPIKPPFHECDDKDFWECLAWMDYDLGGSTPVKIALPDGQQVLVQTGKDGGAYLFDAEHLGKQYDRQQIVKLCGTPTDLCKLSWAGMIVTKPVQTRVADVPVVVIPTFSADNSNPSGLVALKIERQNGQPKFVKFWQFPNSAAPDALQMFRSHPSFPVLTKHLGKQHDALVWLVDIGKHGILYGVRIKDGVMVAKQALQGSGRQLSMPIIDGDKIYLASIMPDTGKAMIEAFRIEPVN